MNERMRERNAEQGGLEKEREREREREREIAITISQTQRVRERGEGEWREAVWGGRVREIEREDMRKSTSENLQVDV